jgi:hypothetical protein
MRTKRHPLSGAIYDVRPDGNVEVTKGELRGVFAADGRWLEGELRSCDAHLCGWIAGPQVPGGRNPKDRPPVRGDGAR